MNYSVELKTGTVVVETWASRHRRTWGLAIGALLLAAGGTILYLRYGRHVAMSLTEATAAASLVGYGLARIATDLWMRERIIFSSTSASRVVSLLGLPLVQTTREFSHPATVLVGDRGIEMPASSFRFGRYLSREDATAIAMAINGFLQPNE